MKRLKRCGGQHGEVARPHFAIVKPGLVERFAGELAHDAADVVGGPLHHRLPDPRRTARRHRVAHAVGQFEERIDQPARVAAASQQRLAPGGLGRQQNQTLRLCGRGNPGGLQQCLRARSVAPCNQDAELVRRRIFRPFPAIHRGPRAGQRPLQLLRRPRDGSGRSDGIGGTQNQRDRASWLRRRPRSAGQRAAGDTCPAEEFPSVDV